ncbi:MAG: NifU N-terminal domain-containing protein [Phycisphaerales bacterium]
MEIDNFRATLNGRTHMASLTFESTPNPNAVKCLLARPLDVPEGTTIPFRGSEAATEHPLAAGLFAIEGVTGLLLARSWVTVNKRAGVPWSSIKPALERVLGRS